MGAGGFGVEQAISAANSMGLPGAASPAMDAVVTVAIPLVMDVRLVFLGPGRQPARWRAQVTVPQGVRALTIGLWGESGRPLAPVVVVPGVVCGTVEVDIGGPRTLPAGTRLRCAADLDDGELYEVEVGVDRRTGAHAFVHADQRIVVPRDAPQVASLSRRDVRRLAQAWPWLGGAHHPDLAATTSEIDASVRDMLRDDFGVDVDDVGE